MARVSIEGPGLYQDDTGHDVRSEFRDLIGDGLSPGEATRRLIEGWAEVLGDEDVYCAFYLALADTQWRLGRLMPAVKDEALQTIESGRDLKRWEYNQRFHRKRAQILGQLKTRLMQTPPAARPIRKTADFVTKLQLGDVVRYVESGGEECFLAVVGLADGNDQRFAIVRPMDGNGLRLISGTRPLALFPHRGVDLPTTRFRVVKHGWDVPDADVQSSLVGCTLVSWGSNLDLLLPHSQSRDSG